MLSAFKCPSKKRNKLKDFLNKRNISTNIYYPLILTTKIFNKLKVDKFMPISKKFLRKY